MHDGQEDLYYIQLVYPSPFVSTSLCSNLSSFSDYHYQHCIINILYPELFSPMVIFVTEIICRY